MKISTSWPKLCQFDGPDVDVLGPVDVRDGAERRGSDLATEERAQRRHDGALSFLQQSHKQTRVRKGSCND